MNTKIVLAGVVAVLFLTGCASVSVSGENWKRERVGVPLRVGVAPYSAASAVLKVDREGEKLKAFQATLGSTLQTQMVDRISRRIAPAGSVPGIGKIEPGHWLVTGEFKQVNQGSRLLRSLFGFGLGGTKMDVLTRIYEADPSGRPSLLAEIQTTGGSNAEPGALFSGPFGAGPRLILQATLSGITADSRRTARMLTAAVAEKLEASGGVLPINGEATKRIGQLPAGETAH